MKKRGFREGICFCLIIFIIITFNGCYKVREKKYYEDKANYITEEAVVDNIIYNEERRYIVLWLSEIDESYQRSEFIIEKENAQTVIGNGIFEKIEIGDNIIFTSAPRHFGDGYFMPIVSLSIGEEEILSFEEGYENLLNSY